MDKDKIKTDKSRRDFLIRLGAGAAALAIIGFFTFDALKTVINDNREETDNLKNISDKPKLSKNIKKEYENGQLVLCGKNGKCLVNKTGEKIIGLLNGRNTLSNISGNISNYYAIEHTDALEVAIASFLCQLGEQGFLSSLFYVTIYEEA